MKVAIVLHLYQPPVQEEGIFRQVASECYLPLIKLLKNRRNHKFTLDTPLSLLEQMERYGYKEWISDVRTLYESERIELMGSAAYHPLLTKIPQQLVEEQISLNEYGLGYYFGSRHGFEGEPSIMIKNIQGFFPPELAVNSDLADTLASFGYKWFIAEKNSLPVNTDSKACIFQIKNNGILVVCRDRELSNIISFKRDHTMNDIYSYFDSKKDNEYPVVICLDAELFGHHYRDGIYVLENMLSKIEELNSKVETVSELVEEYEYSEIDEIRESGWGASDEEFAKGDIYPFWINNKNEIQKELWKLQELVVKEYISNCKTITTSEFQILPIWKTEELKSLHDTELQLEITKYIHLHNNIHSDKFWWVSKKEITGKVLYDICIVEKYLVQAEGFLNMYSKDDICTEAFSKIDYIRSLLK
jgi:predicted glycosyl hydrolase (DUF1957 family)